MNNGNTEYLVIKLVDENNNELDKIIFSKEDVMGAVGFAKNMMGFVPKISFGNKLDILPLATVSLSNGLGGVLVWRVKRKVYEKEIKPLLENLKEKEKEK